MASDIKVFDAACRQAGIIQVNQSMELLDLSAVFSSLPLPKGNRVAVITDGGGPGILATDALENLGMSVAPLSDKALAELKKVLPAEATPANPIDLIASARQDRYGQAVAIVAADESIVFCAALET